MRYCNSNGLCFPDPEVQVSLQISPCPSTCGTQYVLSDGNGNAVFTVPVNSQYTAKIPAGGSSASTLSATVSVGYAPVRTILTYRYASGVLSGIGDFGEMIGGWYGLMAIIAISVGLVLAVGKSGKWYRGRRK